MPQAVSPTDAEVAAALRDVLLTVAGRVPTGADRTIGRDVLLAALRHRLQGRYPDLCALDDVMCDLPAGIDRAAVQRLLGPAGAAPAVLAEDQPVSDEAPWLRIRQEDLGQRAALLSLRR